MLCNSILPEEALDRQRSVILNEIAGDDDPLEQANDLLKQTLWPDHPLGYPIAGSESAIQQATRETLLDFMGRHYRAGQLVLAAAGNVEHNTFVAQARDSFWSMENGEAPAVPLPLPKTNLGTVIAKPRDLQQVYWALAWPAPAYTDPGRYAWHVLAALYGGGMTSRLYRRLREDLGIVYHASAQYHAYGNAGALVVEGVTSPSTLVPALANTLIELFKMSSESINPDDFHRATQSLISQHLISGDSAYVRMSRLALQELYFKRIVTGEKVIAGLRLQSPEAIQRIARDLCGGELPTVALVGSVSEQLLQVVGNMLGDFGEPPKMIVATRPAREDAELESAV
jgi:predicted Zn-dependent peptidase